MIQTKKSAHLLYELIPQDEEAQRILNERAKHLAKPLPLIDKTIQNQRVNYVRFKLGDNEYYGVPFQYIIEVILSVPPTKVPHTPDCISGIINRHGALLPVLDLKPFFHMKVTEETNKKSFLIIIATNNIKIAIIVDYIEGSDSYDPMALDVPLTTENAIQPKYLIGLHHGIIAILNIETIMSNLQSNIASTNQENN